MTQRTLHGRKTVQGFPRPLTVVVGTEPDDTVIAARLISATRKSWYTRFFAFLISLLSKSN